MAYGVPGVKNGTMSRESSRLTIPLDALVSEANPRTSLGSLDWLMQSLTDVGQLEPIGVQRLPRPDAAGHIYKVMFGHKRLAAFKALRVRAPHDARWSEIRADVFDLEPGKAADAAVQENTVRDPLPLHNLHDQIMARRREGDDAETIARRMCVTPAVVDACIIINEHVAPDLVAKLQYDARPEILRYLLMAAKLRGVTLAERHERQRAWWATEGWRERSNGRATQAKKQSKRVSPAVLTRAAHAIESGRRIRDIDGSWIALDPAVAAAIAQALRWALRPAEHKPPV